MSDDWQDASTLADALNETPRAIAGIARGYTDGTKGRHPILRKKPEYQGYVYRLDPNPKWSGEEVRQLFEQLDKDYAEMAEAIGVSPSLLSEVVREGHWVGRPYWGKLYLLAGREVGEIPDWYAVADEVLDRYVVDSVYPSKRHARDTARSDRYAGDTCTPHIFAGQGDRPNVGERMDINDCQEIDVQTGEVLDE